jgi:hypothetical protein
LKYLRLRDLSLALAVLTLSYWCFTELNTENFMEGSIPEYDIQPPALDRYRDIDFEQFQYEELSAERLADSNAPDAIDVQESAIDVDRFTRGSIPEYDIQPPALDRYRDIDVGQFQCEEPSAERIAVAETPDAVDVQESIIDVDEFTRGSIPEYDLEPPALDRYRQLSVDDGKLESMEPPTDEQDFMHGPIPEYELTAPALDRYRELDLEAFRLEYTPSVPEIHREHEAKECSAVLLEMHDSAECKLSAPALDTHQGYEQEECNVVLVEMRDSAVDGHHEREQTECSVKLLELRDSAAETRIQWHEEEEFGKAIAEQRDSEQTITTIVDECCTDDEDVSKPDELDFVSALAVIAREYSKALLEQRDSMQLHHLVADATCSDDCDSHIPDILSLDFGLKPAHAVRCNCTFCRYYSSALAIFSKVLSKTSIDQRKSIQAVFAKEFSKTQIEQLNSAQVVPESKEFSGMALEQRDSTQQQQESKEYSGMLLEERDSVAEAACTDDCDTSSPDILALQISLKPKHAAKCTCTFCRYYASIENFNRKT